MKKLTKKFYLIGSLILVIGICLMTTLILINSNKEHHHNTDAATTTYRIKIPKISVVSIYVSGNGVEKLSSTNYEDTYLVEEGTDVDLKAINESKIFTGWQIIDDSNNVVSNATTDKITLNVTSNLTVSVSRRDPLVSDYGKYIGNPFIISQASDLLKLDKMFRVGTDQTKINSVKEYYDYFFVENLEYLAEPDKETAIANKYFSFLQSGYFLVSNSFSLLDSTFKGIGNATYPFKGVMCGFSEDNVSSIFLTTTDSSGQNEKEEYRGLFGYLDDDSLVRNLTVKTSIGVIDEVGTAENIYAGGLAGYNNGAIVYNVKVSSHNSIITKSANIYAGGLFGYDKGGGIEHSSNVILDQNNFAWILETADTGKTINAGIVAGVGNNTYIKEATLLTADFTVSAKIQANSNSYVKETSINLGNLFGMYIGDQSTTFEDISITGDSGEFIRANTTNGFARVGGLIGYVNATGNITLGKVSFMKAGSESKYTAMTSDASSRGNLFIGGLFGQVEGSNVSTNNEFKKMIVLNQSNETNQYTYNYLFRGAYSFEAINNGITYYKNETRYGRAIAGGLVGRGYININGTNNNDRTDIILTGLQDSMKVLATQTTLTTSEEPNQIESDFEHCSAAMVFGIISSSQATYDIQNINIIANNVTVKATRDLDSKAVGDVRAAGFTGYILGETIQNINVLMNKCDIIGESLSYAQPFGKEGNNTFSAGFVGEAKSNDSTPNEINNVQIAGYDFKLNKIVGTTTRISSIQNSQAGVQSNYISENYAAGFIGRIKNIAISNSTYFGSQTESNYIFMQGHQNPDSAFAGGFVGLMQESPTVTFENNRVMNVKIYAAATNVANYENPDIYVGGLIGAIYLRDYSTTYKGDNILKKCLVYNCDISAIGNERIDVYAGGLVGGITWALKSGTNYFENCFVYGTKVNATCNGNKNGNKGRASAAGICAYVYSNCKATINNSAVIDSYITSNSESSTACAHGIAGQYRVEFDDTYTDLVSMSGCYTNSVVKASGKSGSKVYPIINSSCSTFTNNYYVSGKAENMDSSSIGTALDFTTKLITNNNPFDLFTNMSSAFKDSTKYYLKPHSEGKFEVGVFDTTNIVKVKRKSANASDYVQVWVNIFENGSSSDPNLENYKDAEYMHNNGWFMLGEVLLVAGSSTDDTIVSDLQYSYVMLIENSEFKYNKEKNKFININNPLISYDSIGYHEYDENLGTFDNKLVDREILVKLFDNIPTLKIQFTTFNKEGVDVSSSIYAVEFYTEDNTLINDFSETGFGTYEFTSKTEGNKTTYTLLFRGNNNLTEDKSGYIKFKLSNTDTYMDKVIHIKLQANALRLVGATYANYTKPLNYFDETIGTVTNPYLIRKGSITKFLPIIVRKNDPNQIELIDEMYIDFVSYYASGGGTINENGEFKANTTTSNNLYYVTITLRSTTSEEKQATIYYQIVEEINVSYSAIGSSIDALTYTTTASPYYVLKSTNFEHYGGLPKKFNVTIGTTTYDLNEVINNGWIYDESGNRINAWNIDNSFYQLKIPTNMISGSLNIDIEFNVIYEVSFNINCGVFNPNFEGSKVLSFKVTSGEKFKDVFTEDKKNALQALIDRARIFGYVFNGFYLVDFANSVESYGESFESLDQNLEIYTSYTFYARWSFLIEVVEAPGTHVVTSFPKSFLYKYGKEITSEMTEEEIAAIKKYNEDLKLNRAITIPINNNRGYIFTIQKDDGFIGEADVKAYIVSEEGQAHRTVKEIKIEKYHENMYLYYISPESINGYLVIVTSVSNSELIVGENTATVTEEVLPEDGIYTFKYIVNHRNSENLKSFIYDSGLTDKSSNLLLKRDLLIQFYQQLYDTNTNKTTINDRYLPKGTIISVYYNQYINGVLQTTKSVVGNYIVTDVNGITELKLSEFKDLSMVGNAFEEITFKDLLSDYESLSEAYYFVITPPNGYMMSDEEYGYYKNDIVYVGYLDESRENRFVQGVRSKDQLANIPLEEDNLSEIQKVFSQESSLQEKIYTITPSRNTKLTKDSNTSYTFEDNKQMKLVSFNIRNAEFSAIDKYLRLLCDLDKTTITSSNIKEGILDIRLTFGGAMGSVMIYGSTDGVTYEEIKLLEIDTYEDKEYIISFPIEKAYTYFRIDHVGEEILILKKMAYTVITTGITYNFTPSELTPDASNSQIYHIYRDIIGDERHDGKSFILAMQFKKNGKIVTNLNDYVDDLYITVNGKTYKAHNNQLPGMNVAYFDLTSILNEVGNKKINLTINVPDGLKLSTVQLLEALSIQKPAMSEVRYMYTYN